MGAVRPLGRGGGLPPVACGRGVGGRLGARGPGRRAARGALTKTSHCRGRVGDGTEGGGSGGTSGGTSGGGGSGAGGSGAGGKDPGDPPGGDIAVSTMDEPDLPGR